MGLISYLTTAEAQLGPLAWIFFVGQILGLGAGAYLYFMHTERNLARQTFMRQLGMTLMILAGVGVLLGALRLLNLSPFTLRIWFWVQALVELGVAGYVIYYMRQVLPGLEREARARGLKAPRQPRQGASSPAVPAPPRPVATTSRRDARRDRKRKSR